MKRKRYYIALYITYIAVFIEFSLLLLSLAFEPIDLLLSNRYGEPINIPDKVLGSIPNRRHGDHDSFGFRNKSVIHSPDILTFGDSQTYGINARTERSWPGQLAGLSGKSVYNFSFPSWAPPHYLIQIDKVISMKPRQVLLAIYSGNDLWDSGDLIYRRKGSNLFSHLFERYPDGNVFEELLDSAKAHWAEMSRVLEPGFSHRDSSVDIDKGGIISFVREHSKIWGILRSFKTHLVQRLSKINESNIETSQDFFDQSHWNELELYAEKEYGVYKYQSEKVKTILAPRDRILSQPQTKLGLEAVFYSIEKIRDKLNESNIPLKIVLIPTKEYVYSLTVGSLISDIDGSYHVQTEYEEYVWNQIKKFLNNESLEFIDTTPALQKAVQEDIQIYPYSTQGHPNEKGYKVIAEAVAEAMKNSN